MVKWLPNLVTLIMEEKLVQLNLPFRFAKSKWPKMNPQTSRTKTSNSVHCKYRKLSAFNYQLLMTSFLSEWKVNTRIGNGKLNCQVRSVRCFKGNMQRSLFGLILSKNNIYGNGITCFKEYNLEVCKNDLKPEVF